MKIITAFVSLIIAANLYAAISNGMTYIGTYAQPGQTFMMGYMDQATCVEDRGDWDTDMELCFFDIEQIVEVTGSSQGYNVVVATWGSNAHSCVFEGAVTEVLPNALVSKVPTEVYENGTFVPGVCEVTVTYENDVTVNVSTNGKCQTFCGARAWLEMGPATLKE